MAQRKRIHAKRWWIVLLVFGIVLMVVYIILMPWNISNLSSHPNPVQSYAEAIQRVNHLRAGEPPGMNSGLSASTDGS